MMKSGRHRLLAAVACLAALALTGVAPHAADSPVASAWEQHVFRFQYMGLTSTYSCDGLADKLRLLLLTAGARSDLKVSPSGCTAESGHPDRFAAADLKFSTLRPASTASPTPASDLVSGQWRAVRLEPRYPTALEAGDCELVEQFRDQLLPMFTTRVLKDQTRCVPHQIVLGSPSLKFEVLRQGPAPTAAPGR